MTEYWPCGHVKSKLNTVKVTSVVKGCRFCNREKANLYGGVPKRYFAAIEEMEPWDG